MKHCTYCGKEYSDEVEVCPTDGKPLQSAGEQRTAEPSPPANVPSRDMISPEERHFWERMTFRQFAILTVRLQAVWLLFYAVIDLTYLPRYLTRVRGTSSYSPLYTQMSLDTFLAIVRIILHVAAAVALIQYAERALSWLVKDSISKPPPDQSLQPTAVSPKDSTHD